LRGLDVLLFNPKQSSPFTYHCEALYLYNLINSFYYDGDCHVGQKPLSSQ
jgi:hypothetical protein